MTAMLRWVLLLLVAAVGCGRERNVPAPSAPPAVAPSGAPSPPSPPSPAPAAPPDPGDGPALTVRNPQKVDLDIHGAYLVDRDGMRGTLALWPDRRDCPDAAHPSRRVPAGGMLRLPAPAHVFVPGQCAPAALAPGEYVLRLESGHGDELYAAAQLTLPLAGELELRFERHEQGPACDPALARRAARLVFADARESGASFAGFEAECDVSTARCGTLPLDENLPPSRCTVTLHERLLRVERPAGDDTPRWLTAWLDPEIVYARRPSLPRTSASRALVAGAKVVVAGVTTRHRHEHGGAAARVGHATFQAHNPLRRALRLSVTGVEYLVENGCSAPERVQARPRLRDVSVTEIVPGESELVVGFEPQGAYQAYCNRFATRVTFRVEGQTLAATVEHEVTRIEPLRREP